ncbi:hypothetical protein ABPG74_020943 [Tetrahymena malaccensis]
MDQIQKRNCLEHNLSITCVYADSKSKDVLKCLDCLQQNIDFQKIIPIESIQLNDNELTKKWTLSKENDLTQYYEQLNEDIKQQNYEQRIKNTQKQFKQLILKVQNKIETQMDKQIQLIKSEQEKKQYYLAQFKSLTYWDQFKDLIANNNKYNTMDLNKDIKQIIQKSENNSNNAKQILSNIIGEIQNIKNSQQKSTSFYQDIYKLIEETMLNFQDKKTKPVFSFQQQPNYQDNNPNKEEEKKFNFQKNGNFFPQNNQNNQQQDNNRNKTFQQFNWNSNNQQQNQFNENRYDSNQKQQFSQNNSNNSQENLQKIQQIMNLISNKTNGCQNKFLQDVENILINTKEIFLNLNFTNAYLNNEFPLQFKQLDENQFSNLIKYSKSPSKYQLIKADEEKDNQKQDEKINQELINFEQTNFQQSKQFKIKLENNLIFIDNTNKCLQGQIVTSTPLSLQKVYSFKISLNKSFVNNLLYFGLISPQDKDTKALKDVQEGFSFSNLSAKKPKLVYGDNFQDENIKIEVRINLKNGSMHILQYPEFSTIYVQKLKDQQNTHFGIQYQTEQQFKINIFEQQVIDI